MEIVPHVTEESLEQYVMGTLPDSESDRLDDHLVNCQSCRDRLSAEIDFVKAMRRAAAMIREGQRSSDGVKALQVGSHQSDFL